MPEARIARLGITFLDGGRSITFRRVRRLVHCACRTPLHDILPGDLVISVTTHRSGERQKLHPDHLHRNWNLIVVDRDDTEVARFHG